MSEDVKREALDWSLIAENIRLWRKAQDLTQEELASKAGVTDVTLYHAESGRPVSLRTLKKIASGLDIQLSGICFDRRHIPEKDQPYVLHRGEKATWAALGDKRKHDGIDRKKFDMDEAERRRVATVGLVAGYIHTTQFVMPDGPGVVMFELYGPWEGEFNPTLYRDVVLLCLEGRVTVTIKGSDVSLGQGDAVGFLGKHLSRLEPDPDSPSNQLPVRLLWVGANRIGKVSSSTKKVQASARARNP